jgi:hypothetical protein
LAWAAWAWGRMGINLQDPGPLGPGAGAGWWAGQWAVAGQWVAGTTGHRKGQLRVIGSPSALRTKGPGARWPGATVARGPGFCLFAKAPW